MALCCCGRCAMDKNELKQMVAELLREMDAPVPATDCESCSTEDLTKVDLRQTYLVENPASGEAFLRLKKKTPARLGLGRCGARYRTMSMLRFRADHAAAQDSVFSLVKPEFYENNDLTFVQTMC